MRLKHLILKNVVLMSSYICYSPIVSLYSGLLVSLINAVPTLTSRWEYLV